MKNISKTIAAISMSLITIGAFAQSTVGIKAGHMQKPTIFVKPIPKATYFKGNHKTTERKISGGPTYNGQLNYPAWDNNVNSGAYQGSNANNGWGATLINMAYNVHDTGAGATKNFELLHMFTIACDSLWDWYSLSQLSPASTQITLVDTIWALVSYKNTSSTIDTVIFQGVNTVAGYPGTTQLFADTLFLGDPALDSLIGSAFGDSLTNGYYLGVLPNYTPAPNTSFAINLKEYGSKLDSFEVFYGFPDFTCSPYEYATHSAVGIPLPGLAYCNTFTTGWITVFGSVTEMPKSNGGYVYYGVTSCGDTGFYYEQDAAIFVSFEYTIGTGISTVDNNNLFVAQNFPNPFNKTTQITYSLTKSSDVTFSVYDMTGRAIINNVYTNSTPGQHEISLDANSFSPGVYFYTFDVNGSKVTKKMIITE